MRVLAVCFLILLPLAHAESGPSDAAVAYLVDVARSRVDLGKDTAMTADTTKEKQSIIRAHLKQLSSSVDQGDLRPIDEKIEGDLAAVLVSRITDYDPSQLQVFAIAMLKRNDSWLPAPILASFENTGIAYLPGLSDSARKLETWMLRERTIHLTRLRKELQTGLFEDIGKAMNIDELRESSAEEIVDGFINACRAKNLPAALAYLGGHSDSLPDDWTNVFHFVFTNIRNNKESTEAWRRLISTAGARAVVKTETYANGVTVSLGEFSPFQSTPGLPAINLFHFPLDRSKEGLWRLSLPSWLQDGDLPERPDPSDAELIKAFPAKLIEQLPPASFSTPDALMESFQQALSSPRFEAVLPYIGLSESGDALPTLAHAAYLWRDFRGRDGFAPLLLDVRQKNDQACALLSLFDARNPRISPKLVRRIYLQQSNKLWTITCSLGETPDGTDPELIAWADEASGLSEADWLTRLGLAATLGGIPADSAPTEEGALTAAKAWLNAIQARDPRAILRSAAAFDDENGIRRLFRTIGHELQSHRQTKILKIHRNGRWAAVSALATSSDRRDHPYYLLYPIVSTQSGPRVLVESVLFHADNRSLEFLNSSAWNRLEDRLPEAALTELKEIQKAHTALAEAP